MLFAITLFSVLSCNQVRHSGFIIADKTSGITIYIDGNSDELIKWAAYDLAGDIEKIAGRKILVNVTANFNPNAKGIYLGKIDDALMKNLPENDACQLEDQ